MYSKPLDTPQVKENCTTGFKKTSLSSTGAMRLTLTKAKVRLSKTQENKRDYKQPIGKQHADNKSEKDTGHSGGKREKEEETGRKKMFILLFFLFLFFLFLFLSLLRLLSSFDWLSACYLPIGCL